MVALFEELLFDH
jgi:hypothetical protein